MNDYIITLKVRYKGQDTNDNLSNTDHHNRTQQALQKDNM